MQCLYCEEELKPFRGLFDEDFCSREHREKYLSSFRKAMSLSPAFVIQPAENSTSQIAEAAGEPVPITTIAEQAPVEIAAAEELLPADAFVPQTTAPAAEEQVPSATFEERVRVVIGAAEAQVPTAGENAAYDPAMADFLPIAIPTAAPAESCRLASPDAFSACRAIKIPKRETVWTAALEAEEGLADLVDPVQIASVAGFGDTPVPLHIAPARVPAAMDKGSAAASLETAVPAVSGENDAASGHASPWNYAQAVPLGAIDLSVPSFCASAAAAALPPEDRHAELTLFCEQLASRPILACEVALAHECYIPAFAPSREAMQGDEQQEPARGVAEIAPALAMSSAPIDRPVLVPGCSSEMMPLSLGLAAAPPGPASERLNVPALASPLEGQPNLAPGLMADIPQGAAVNSAATPHSHAPLRASFGSLVRIKNWRLRITFAKPA